MRVFIVVSLILVGRASQYRPNVMEATVEARQNGEAWIPLPSELPRVDGYISTCDCREMGMVFRLRPVGQRRWERFLVADCGGPQLRDDGLTACEWMSEHGIMAEVDHRTAQRWGTVGKLVAVERLMWTAKYVPVEKGTLNDIPRGTETTGRVAGRVVQYHQAIHQSLRWNLQ